MIKTTSLELWKTIEGYEGLYEISNLGRIKSLSKVGSKRELILKIDKTTQYPTVHLNKDNKHKTLKLHRLLAIMFIPNPRDYKTVNHIDGNKHNYSLENLEWCTDKQNRLHAYATGLMSKAGEKNGNAKLTAREVSFVRYLKGLYPDLDSQHVGNFYGVRRETINEIWRFNKWK